jgi:eukaryotic-like serine/threonine-protein kinase
MPVCPHCQTRTDQALILCPTMDGYYTIDEEEYARFKDDKLLGTSISDRYVFTSIIGHGSIGPVYRGYQPNIQRNVVLKVFKLQNILDEQLGFMPNKTLAEARDDAHDRFVREARVLAQLSHPNCVTLYDFGSADDGSYLYIAMEFVAGISMRRAIQRGLRFEAVLEIIRQILFALRQAHALGIVHRDLKPENIILSFRHEAQEPVVKVLDFGIAKLLQQDGVQSTAASGMLFGTPAYMSPEQCRGASDEVTTSSDVYALGCILYEIVCGQLPFPGKTPQQMIVMHQESPVPPIKPRPNFNVPDELATYIRTCLHKDPTQRYADARAALRVLEGMMARWGFLQARPVGDAGKPGPEPATADISADSSQDMLAVFDSIVSKPRTDTAEVSVSQIARDRFNALDRPEQAGRAPATAAGGVLETSVGPASAAAASGDAGPMVGYTVVAPGRSPERVQRDRTRDLILAASVFAVLTFCILLFFFFFRSL